MLCQMIGSLGFLQQQLNLPVMQMMDDAAMAICEYCQEPQVQWQGRQHSVILHHERLSVLSVHMMRGIAASLENIMDPHEGLVDSGAG